MQTGVITPDNLSQVLRGLSQKRKSGIFEINCVEHMIYLHFQHGKIIEVIDTRKHAIQDLFDRLKAAGCIPDGMQCNFAGESEPYKALFLALNQNPEESLVDEDLFRMAIKHRVLDQLYDLDLGSGAYYNFKLQMPAGEKDFLPGIPVGTLLLDFVALETDAGRFNQIFQDNIRIVRKNDMSASTGEEDMMIFQLLAEPISLADLRKRSLLSSFHIQDTLLGMYDRGELELVGAEQVASRSKTKASAPAKVMDDQEMDAGTSSSGMVDDLVAALEASIDESFSEATSELEALGQAADRIFPDVMEEDQDFASEAEEDDQYDDEDYEDEFEEREDPNVAVQLSIQSMKLLNADWVPSAVGLIFAATALLLPFFTWRSVLALFSGY